MYCFLGHLVFQISFLISYAAAAQEEAKVPAKPTGRYIPGAFREKYKKERSGVPPDISSQAVFPSLLNTVSE